MMDFAIDTGVDEVFEDAPIPQIVADYYAACRYVYVDIETLPSQSPAYRERLLERIKAPATYKKPESIEAWLAENRDSATDEEMARTSFDGGRGHICTIAWAFNGGEIDAAHAEKIEDEAAVIQKFFDSLDEYHSQTMVGHNVAAFDLPFLKKRAIVLGLTLPRNLPRDPKPWDKSVNDTMIMWAGVRDRVSLDNLCDILGIPGKDGFDGSMVADAWAAGQHETIREYCKDDIRRTRAVHQRFLASGW